MRTSYENARRRKTKRFHVENKIKFHFSSDLIVSIVFCFIFYSLFFIFFSEILNILLNRCCVHCVFLVSVFTNVSYAHETSKSDLYIKNYNCFQLFIHFFHLIVSLDDVWFKVTPKCIVLCLFSQSVFNEWSFPFIFRILLVCRVAGLWLFFSCLLQKNISVISLFFLSFNRLKF